MSDVQARGGEDGRGLDGAGGGVGGAGAKTGVGTDGSGLKGLDGAAGGIGGAGVNTVVATGGGVEQSWQALHLHRGQLIVTSLPHQSRQSS